VGTLAIAAAAAYFLLFRGTAGAAPSAAVPASSTPTAGASSGSPPLGAPGAPVELQEIASTATSVTVECAPVDGAVQYNWYTYGTNLLLATSPTYVAVISGLQANTSYEVYCAAVNAVGQVGPPSEPLLITTQPAQPTVTTVVTQPSPTVVVTTTAGTAAATSSSATASSATTATGYPVAFVVADVADYNIARQAGIPVNALFYVGSDPYAALAANDPTAGYGPASFLPTYQGQPSIAVSIGLAGRVRASTTGYPTLEGATRTQTYSLLKQWLAANPWAIQAGASVPASGPATVATVAAATGSTTESSSGSAGTASGGAGSSPSASAASGTDYETPILTVQPAPQGAVGVPTTVIAATQGPASLTVGIQWQWQVQTPAGQVVQTGTGQGPTSSITFTPNQPGLWTVQVSGSGQGTLPSTGATVPVVVPQTRQAIQVLTVSQPTTVPALQSPVPIAHFAGGLSAYRIPGGSGLQLNTGPFSGVPGTEATNGQSVFYFLGPWPSGLPYPGVGFAPYGQASTPNLTSGPIFAEAAYLPSGQLAGIFPAPYTALVAQYVQA